MKNLFLFMLTFLMVTACGNSEQKKTTDTKVSNNLTDSNTVYVYYFHGKQRCMTCNTVEKVAKQTITDNYASNDKVKFVVLATFDKENEAIVEKYEVSWNGLLIVKGDMMVDLTEQAFANAVDNPNVLTDLIKSEVTAKLSI